MKYLTSLEYNSPWHVKIIRQSRYNTYGSCYKYKITDNNETRLYASNADFYSFGIAILRVLGIHCQGSNSLCMTARRIVSQQQNSFVGVADQEFVLWDTGKMQQVFVPYWQRIQDILREHIRWNPYEHTFFVTTLANWLRSVRC